MCSHCLIDQFIKVLGSLEGAAQGQGHSSSFCRSCNIYCLSVLHKYHLTKCLGIKRPKKISSHFWTSKSGERCSNESDVALNACLDSLHVCACDVVKVQKHGGCVPGMELENVPVSLSLASEEEPPTLAPAPALLCACLPLARCIASVSLPGHEGIRFVLEGRGGARRKRTGMRKAGKCEEEN